MTAYWNIVLCNLLEIDWHFRGALCLFHCHDGGWSVYMKLHGVAFQKTVYSSYLGVAILVWRGHRVGVLGEGVFVLMYKKENKTVVIIEEHQYYIEHFVQHYSVIVNYVHRCRYWRSLWIGSTTGGYWCITVFSFKMACDSVRREVWHCAASALNWYSHETG
jgi:hypothetical protein